MAIDHLIAKYLDRTLTETEAGELKNWVESDPVNREIFENIVAHKDLSGTAIETSKQEIFQKITGNVAMPGRSVDLKQHKAFSFWKHIRGAAAIFIIGLSALGVWWHARYQSPVENTPGPRVLVEKETRRGQKLTFRLPDGSVVKLNAASALSYFENTLEGKREVKLAGEAFFEVVEDKNRPFIIQTKDLDVQVLGTSFNVKAFPGEANTQVAVATGKVAVSVNQQDIAPGEKELIPGEMLSFSTETGATVTKGFDWNEHLGWKDNILYFKDKRLESVLTRLSRTYNVNFEVKKNLNMSKKITATYKEASLEEILMSLSAAYKFEYEMNTNEVIIK